MVDMAEDNAAFDLVLGWIETATLPPDGRLPSERELGAQLGIGRSELRKALATLEGQGCLNRHVGRGTFLVSPPRRNGTSLAGIANRTSPLEAMQARLVVEPEIARLAALAASPAQLAELRQLSAQIRQATTWDEYESRDWRFHNMIAEACGYRLLVEIQYLVNAVRQDVVWSHLTRGGSGPPANYRSFVEHDAIVDAISRRDRRAAAEAMRQHLNSTSMVLSGEVN
jgi:DNA-binding FadR family transcriptional regulator